MVMEDAREMLHDQDLAMHRWAEAARTTMYVCVEYVAACSASCEAQLRKLLSDLFDH